MSNVYIERSPDYLEHHGILGQKWGVRRYQNPDGSLTAEGRKRYGDILTPDQMKNMIKSYNIRTGSNKKINKHTVFKTKRGLYDYKGRKLDDNTDVDDPGLQNAKKSKADKKAEKEAARKAEMEANKKTPTNKDFRKMSDEELAATVQRMRNEAEFLRLDSMINPKKVSVGKEMANNLRDNLVRDIPAGISGLVRSSIMNLAASSDKGGGDSQQSQPQPKKKPQNPSIKSAVKSHVEEINRTVTNNPSNENKTTNLFRNNNSDRSNSVDKKVSELSSGNKEKKPGWEVKSNDTPSLENTRSLFSSKASNNVSSALSTNVNNVPEINNSRPLFSSGSSNNSSGLLSSGIRIQNVNSIRDTYYSDLWQEHIRLKHSAIKTKKGKNSK